MKNTAKNGMKIAGSALFLGLFPLVTMGASPTLTFSVNPQTIMEGEATAVSWFTQNIDYCVISGGWASILPPYGSANVFPRETTSYAINCTGPNGNVSDTKTVFVNKKGSSPQPLPPPIVYSATPPNFGLIPIPTPPIPIAPPTNTFTAACATSPTVTETNRIVSFAAAETGGFAPIVYRWNGDIAGSQQVENIAFEHVGIKTAKITITDSRGLSAEGYCSVTVNARTPSPAPTPPTVNVGAKKPTVVVAQAPAPTCKTVTLCIDTAGNVIPKDASEGSGTTPKNENQIETAKNGNSGKTFFLASLFGSGNGSGGNGSKTARNFAVYLLPVLAAAFIIFIGYMAVRMSKKA